MSNLPYETSEHDVVAFFREFGVGLGDVALQRRPDSGQVHAALVKFRDASTASSAMALDGAQLGSRTVHLKIDGMDRRSSSGNRGGGFSSGNFVPHGVGSPPGYGDGGQWGGRERRSYGSSGFGGAAPRDGGGDGGGAGGFGSRERKGYGGVSGHFEPAGGQFGGASGGSGRDREEGGGGRERRGPGMQAADPTIPEGPPPEGRKKLQLKPRTKPPPKLDIDTRQIDPPVRSQGHPRSGVGLGDVDNRGSGTPVRAGGVNRFKGENISRPNSSSSHSDQSKVHLPAAVPAVAPGTSPGLNGTSRRNVSKEEKGELHNTFAALNTEESSPDGEEN
jgi:hypothetical protein